MKVKLDQSVGATEGSLFQHCKVLGVIKLNVEGMAIVDNALGSNLIVTYEQRL